MEPADLADRISRIRLRHKDIAALAPLDQNTVSRVLRGDDVLTSSVEKIEQVVLAEEIRLRDHLLALHPVDAGAT